jgi:hypothetical protein
MHKENTAGHQETIKGFPAIACGCAVQTSALTLRVGG